MMAKEELEIEISPTGKVTARTIGVKGPRRLDLADLLARLVGREESRTLTNEYYETEQQLTRTNSIYRSASVTHGASLVWDAMQCPSCQFENMPGAPVCGRCGAQLRLAAARLTSIRRGPAREPSSCGAGFPRTVMRRSFATR